MSGYHMKVYKPETGHSSRNDLNWNHPETFSTLFYVTVQEYTERSQDVKDEVLLL